MRTDKQHCLIFEANPQWLFELTGLPGPCRFQSVSLKALFFGFFLSLWFSVFDVLPSIAAEPIGTQSAAITSKFIGEFCLECRCRVGL